MDRFNIFRRTSRSTETMAFHSSSKVFVSWFEYSYRFMYLDGASSMITCPLTTTELAKISMQWKSYRIISEHFSIFRAWSETDGVWSTRITAQAALPVDDIEE